jgi:hypothetical protein
MATETDHEHMTDEERDDDIQHLLHHTYHHRRDCHHARELRDLLGRAIDHIQHYREIAVANRDAEA